MPTEIEDSTIKCEPMNETEVIVRPCSPESLSSSGSPNKENCPHTTSAEESKNPKQWQYSDSTGANFSKRTSTSKCLVKKLDAPRMWKM
ncbi:unnamed protein product [Oikopleura dioica]|uniref:Uncharacterized protein n=1 Tax=Oikopleura dioica TaxID=34765 RepID=E4WRM6_OIKDI|nr:unnamed protein product [Oikopleura dioica]